MKKRQIGLIGMAALMGASFANVATAPQYEARTAQETRAVKPSSRTRQNHQEASRGYSPGYGRSHESVPPKLYGMKYGHGNGKKKTNFLRLKHNAKLKRRMSA